MGMVYYQLSKSSYQESLKILKADIQHANSLAAAIPRAKCGANLQMKLVYNQLAPLFLFLLQCLSLTCIQGPFILPPYFISKYISSFLYCMLQVYTDGRSKMSRHGRKATIREFYGVILPSLQKLHDNLEDLEDDKEVCITKGSPAKKRVELDNRLRNIDFEREDECGICLEPCTKMVLPNCCHAMCIKCYRNWNIKSESCPFCRCSLKRVNSEDLCAYLQRRCGRQ